MKYIAQKAETILDLKNKAPVETIARTILRVIFSRRCLLDDSSREDTDHCSEEELSPHLQRVMLAIEHNRPLEMVLPAFPGKSPNRKKTLSALPDAAEWLAIDQLYNLCQQIQEIYAPGARLIICSDGYVFSDVVRIPDSEVKAYTRAIADYCAQKYPGIFSMYDLKSAYKELSCLDSMREELIIQHGSSFITLKERVRKEKSTLIMYRGITRFLKDDYAGLAAFANYSNTQLQKQARSSAYRVMHRSEAWSALLKKQFPDALRLSIHPQFRVSEKIGIKLVESDDLWRTPWHSVAVFNGSEVRLEKRANIDETRFKLVFNKGRPTHYISSVGLGTMSPSLSGEVRHA